MNCVCELIWLYLCLQSDLRGKLGLLDMKITKNEDVISQMRDIQNKLKVTNSACDIYCIIHIIQKIGPLKKKFA